MRKIGKVKDAHGIKGELKIYIFSGDFSWIDKLKVFELESDKGIKKSFELQSYKETPDFLILKTSIKDRTEAEAYKGWSFSIPDELFISEPGETIYLTEIQGFILQSEAGHELGEIVGFSSNGFQDLLQVKSTSGIFEIPFVDEFLIEISFPLKKVIMDLPEGLFDADLVGKKKT